ncbi:MAG: hypothetical protein ACXAB9_11075 [Candidatus Thorarchaeota archaeon]
MRKEECEVCGQETDVLDQGTGKYAEKLVCKLCEDRNFREQLLRVKIAELEAGIKSLVIAVFRSDKTPLYGYGGKGKSDKNRFGNLPKGVGKRWATPLELAQGYARKHGFERELFEGNPDG